eukprot:m.226019 g.226019  ORF g.226019 m.226019 type:complete len:174 (+) comp40024_c0_seq4:667-1188(+)
MDWDWNSEKSFDGYDDYNDYYDGYDNDYYDPGDSEGQEEYNFDSSTDFELRQGQGQASTEQDGRKSGESKISSPPSLYTLAAGKVGRTMPFEGVEAFSEAVQVIPDNVQLSIMKAAFPTDKSTVRRCAYMCRNSDDYGAYDDLEADDEMGRQRREADRLYHSHEGHRQLPTSL